jgi:hypothetical protein
METKRKLSSGCKTNFIQFLSPKIITIQSALISTYSSRSIIWPRNSTIQKNMKKLSPWLDI